MFRRPPGPLEIRPGELAQAKLELASRDGLLHRVGVTVELGADRRSNEVRTIGIESLSNQQIDMAEIDIAQIYRDLLAIAAPIGFFIQRPSSHHPYGWYLVALERDARPSRLVSGSEKLR